MADDSVGGVEDDNTMEATMGGHILGTMHTDPQRGEVAGLESSVVAPSRRIPFFTAASLSNPPATPSAIPPVSALAPPSPPSPLAPPVPAPVSTVSTRPLVSASAPRNANASFLLWRLYRTSTVKRGEKLQKLDSLMYT